MKEQNAEKKTVKTIPVRPFCLEYQDAKNEVFTSVNNAVHKHNIPFYLMENILSEALHKVREGAKAEMQQASDLYKKQIDELDKT